MISSDKTVTQIIDILKKRGYTENFNLLEENISYKKDGGKVNFNDLIIDKIIRYTGVNDLEDESILFAISNKKDGTKGVFVNGYGTYTDSKANEIISKIKVEEIDKLDWTSNE